MSPVEGETSQRKKRTEVKIFKVHEKHLRVYNPPPPDTAPIVKLHPSLQPAGVLLTPQNFNQAERDYHACAVMHGITDLVIETRDSSSRVKICQQSPTETVPLSLQCRATEAFGAKKLMLIPGNAGINLLVASQEEEEEEASKSRMDANKNNQKKKEKFPIHNSMLGEVRGKIQQGVKDGRYKQSSKPDDKSTSFQLISPLFQMCSQRKSTQHGSCASILGCDQVQERQIGTQHGDNSGDF